MRNIIFILFVVLLFSECRKPDAKDGSIPQLPPATRTGANMLACKINGKIFTAYGAGGKMSQSGYGVLFAIYQDSTTFISATSQYPTMHIIIGTKYNFILGTYQITQTPFINGGEFDDYTNGTLPLGTNQFNTNSTYGGSVTYTYFDGNILAGTFAFDAVNINDSVIHVTEGRFDIANHY